MSDDRPPVTGHSHDLPFGQLSPRKFEQLGYWLLEREGFTRLAHLGASGNDGGIDVAGWRDGHRVVVQCKRYESLGPSAAAAAVQELLKRPLEPPAEELLLLAACDVSRDARDGASEAANGLQVEVWARTELDEKVKRHRDVLREFFNLGDTVGTRFPFAPPAPPDRFAGRVEILERLLDLLVAGQNVGITAVQGMGGIGKTALALVIANCLYRDHRATFPGGVLWAELGPEPDLLTLLDGWARSASPHLDLTTLPDAASRAKVLRQTLARWDRACVVLDDVWDVEQASQLLQAVPDGWARVLTTRDGELARRLDCRVERLGVLTESETLDLLTNHLGPLNGHESAARRLHELAEGLPLALRIAAGQIDEPSQLGELVEALAAQPPLALLKLAEQREDSVEICLSLSYQQLSQEDQLRFRALGAFAPAPFDEAALAAVWGEEPTPPQVLRAFLRRSLLERDPATKALRQHALLRAAARALLEGSPAEEGEVSARHADHYRQLVKDAQWQEAEAAYEQVRHAWARVSIDPERVAGFALAAARFQKMRGFWKDRVEWLEKGLSSCSSTTEPPLRARLQNETALAYSALGRKEEALRTHEQALAIRREVGDRGGEGSTLNNIARVYSALGRKEEALRTYEQALAIRREVGDRGGEAPTLNTIGLVYSDLGRKEEALRTYEQALAITREVGNRGGEAPTLHNIARVCEDLGRNEEALCTYEQALAILREVGNRWGEKVTLFNIGWLYDSLGQTAETVEHLEACVALDEELGHPDLESDRAFLEEVRAKLAS